MTIQFIGYTSGAGVWDGAQYEDDLLVPSGAQNGDRLVYFSETRIVDKNTQCPSVFWGSNAKGAPDMEGRMCHWIGGDFEPIPSGYNAIDGAQVWTMVVARPTPGFEFIDPIPTSLREDNYDNVGNSITTTAITTTKGGMYICAFSSKGGFSVSAAPSGMTFIDEVFLPSSGDPPASAGRGDFSMTTYYEIVPSGTYSRTASFDGADSMGTWSILLEESFSSSSSSQSSSSYSSCAIDVEDGFIGNDGDPPDFQTWSIFASGTGNGPEIQNNALRCSVGPGLGEEGVQSNTKFIGNFDVEVDWTIVSGADIGTQAWNAGLETRFIGDSNNRARMSIDGHTTTYVGSSIVNGTPDSSTTPTTSTSGSFRVERVGSTFNTYYFSSGWVLLHTKTIGTSACEVRLYLENSISNPGATFDFDNFEVNSTDDVICASSSSSSSSSLSSSSSSSSSESSSSSSSSSSLSSSSSSLSSSSSSLSSSSSSISSSSSSSISSSSSSSSSESSSSSSESSSSSSSLSNSSSSSSFSSSSSSSSSFFDASRTYFWHYVLDEEGRPIENAQIRLYLDDDPTTEANIYLTEISPTFTTTSEADITTDNDGFFNFWLGNEWEDGGYSNTQGFRLEWYKAGIAPGIIESISPFANAFAFVDTNQGADKDSKNKFVSDFLATKWWNHINAFVPSASPHDLEPVDVTKGCGVGEDRYNKVVNNKLFYEIVQWSNTEASESLSYGGVNEYQESVTSWSTSSGVFFKDITHSNIKSKNVSVQVVKLSDSNQIEPKKIINLSSSVTRIVMDFEENVRVNIQGSSSSSTSSSSTSSS